MALLGLLVFLNGHQIHRPHFVNAAFARPRPAAPTAFQSVAAPLAAISSGVSVCDFGRAFVGEGDGDALAADVVEVEVIFLLDFFAQVLHRHVFLRQFDFNAAALVLQFRQTAALRAQIFFARRRCPLPANFSAPSNSAVCALTCSRSCASVQSCRANPEFPIPPAPCARRTRNISLAPLLDQLREFADALLQRLLLLAEGRRKSARPTRGRLCFRSAPRWPRRAAGADFPVRRVSAATCCLRVAFAAFPSSFNLRRQRVAFLQAFLLLRGEALNFKNHRLNFLVQQARWNFAAR